MISPTIFFFPGNEPVSNKISDPFFFFGLTQQMDPIREIADRILQDHLNVLNTRRQRSKLYKRVSGGKMHGQPFVMHGNVYRSLRAKGHRMRRLRPEQKKGDDAKYWQALNAILDPCVMHDNVKEKQYCPYCCLRAMGKKIPSTSALHFLFENKDDLSPCYKNNMAPTRAVLRRLGEDEAFRTALFNLKAERAPSHAKALPESPLLFLMFLVFMIFLTRLADPERPIRILICPPPTPLEDIEANTSVNSLSRMLLHPRTALSYSYRYSW